MLLTISPSINNFFSFSRALSLSLTLFRAAVLTASTWIGESRLHLPTWLNYAFCFCFFLSICSDGRSLWLHVAASPNDGNNVIIKKGIVPCENYWGFWIISRPAALFYLLTFQMRILHEFSIFRLTEYLADSLLIKFCSI